MTNMLPEVNHWRIKLQSLLSRDQISIDTEGSWISFNSNPHIVLYDCIVYPRDKFHQNHGLLIEMLTIDAIYPAID